MVVCKNTVNNVFFDTKGRKYHGFGPQHGPDMTQKQSARAQMNTPFLAQHWSNIGPTWPNIGPTWAQHGPDMTPKRRVPFVLQKEHAVLGPT